VNWRSEEITDPWAMFAESRLTHVRPKRMVQMVGEDRYGMVVGAIDEQRRKGRADLFQESHDNRKETVGGVDAMDLARGRRLYAEKL